MTTSWMLPPPPSEWGVAEWAAVGFFALAAGVLAFWHARAGTFGVLAPPPRPSTTAPTTPQEPSRDDVRRAEVRALKDKFEALRVENERAAKAGGR